MIFQLFVNFAGWPNLTNQISIKKTSRPIIKPCISYMKQILKLRVKSLCLSDKYKLVLFRAMAVYLQIISWREQEYGLYDYRSEPYQNSQFKANRYRFPAPQPGKPAYYFIHHSTAKNVEHPFRFEFRKARQCSQMEDPSPERCIDGEQPCSDNRLLERKMDYKLIGGFKVQSRQGDNRSRRKLRVSITAIALKDIQVKGIANRGQMTLPFWVVRSLNKWIVREGQVIKFGRLQLRVEEEYTEKVRKMKEYVQQGDVLDLDQKYQQYSQLTAQKMGSQGEQKRCRICYGEEQEGKNILINPCNCKGSIQFLHLQCLRRWLDSRLTKISLQSGGNIKVADKNCCELCKMRFPTRVKKNDQVMPLIQFLEQDNPYICFSPYGPLGQQEKFYVTFGEQNSVRIGRLEDSGLYLAEQTVSRKHAILQIQKQRGCILKDEQSKYGTLAYQPGKNVQLGYSLRAFQITNSAFCFTYR